MEIIKILEVIGTSKKNWEDSANNAVKFRDKLSMIILGIEVVGQTAKVGNGKISEYRTTIKIAFKVKNKR